MAMSLTVDENCMPYWEFKPIRLAIFHLSIYLFILVVFVVSTFSSFIHSTIQKFIRPCIHLPILNNHSLHFLFDSYPYLQPAGHLDAILTIILMDVFWVNDDFIISGGEFFFRGAFTSVVFSNRHLWCVTRCAPAKRTSQMLSKSIEVSGDHIKCSPCH